MEVCGQDEMSVQPYIRFVPSTGSWTPSQETTRSQNTTFAVMTIVVITKVIAMSHQTGREPAGTASPVRPAQRSSMILLMLNTVVLMELAGCLVGMGIPPLVMGWSPGKSALFGVAVMIAHGKQMLMSSIAKIPSDMEVAPRYNC